MLDVITNPVSEILSDESVKIVAEIVVKPFEIIGLLVVILTTTTGVLTGDKGSVFWLISSKSGYPSLSESVRRGLVPRVISSPSANPSPSVSDFSGSVPRANSSLSEIPSLS